MYSSLRAFPIPKSCIRTSFILQKVWLHETMEALAFRQTSRIWPKSFFLSRSYETFGMVHITKGVWPMILLANHR